MVSLDNRLMPLDPTSLVIFDSGGKDSTITTNVVVEQFKGKVPIYVLHQELPECWPGTAEYVQKTCDRLGVPLIIQQAYYHAYECQRCGHRYTSQAPQPICRNNLGEKDNINKIYCRGQAKQIGEIRGVMDLMEWRDGRWPSDGIRFCTSYMKEAIGDGWCSQNRDKLGSRPFIVMGERWAESKRRAKLVPFHIRESRNWIQVWHPILDFRRVDVFGGLFERGIEPHYCYELQGLTREMMMEDVEGGPRCSCIMCFYLTPANMKKNLEMEMNKPMLERLLAMEARHGHYFRTGLPLAQIMLGNFKPDLKNHRGPARGEGGQIVASVSKPQILIERQLRMFC